MKLRLKNKENSYKKLQLKNLNTERSRLRLIKRVDIFDRILLALSTSSVPRVCTIVRRCMDAHRSAAFVLQKIEDAIAEKYNPNYTKEGKQIPQLVLKLGGPGRLEILHKSRGFPVCSTAYRFVRKNKVLIDSHISLDMEDPFGQCVEYYRAAHVIFVGLKIYGTFGDPRPRWDPKTNRKYVFCKEHASEEKLTFDRYHR